MSKLAIEVFEPPRHRSPATRDAEAVVLSHSRPTLATFLGRKLFSS